MKRSNLAGLIAALSIAAMGHTVTPANIAVSARPSSGRHRAPPLGNGSIKVRRAARKARNVRTNRRNHRG